MSDLATLISRRTAYVAAEAAILKRQEYSITVDGSTRALKYADLREVRQAITDLDTAISVAEGRASRRGRVRYVALRR